MELVFRLLVFLFLLYVGMISSAQETDVVYFAYGSNMKYNRIAERVGRVVTVGKASLDGYELRFNKFGSDGTGKANVVLNEGQKVHGVLYRCTNRQLDALDQFEGVPNHYTREVLEITQDSTGEKISAVVYIASKRNTINPGLPPSTEYLNFILDGAREHDFPEEFGVHLHSLLNLLGYREDGKNDEL